MKEQTGTDNDDLTNKEFSTLDIMKVYDVIYDLEALIYPRCLRLLWQRSEVKEVTMAEVEEKFGCKVKAECMRKKNDK